jgi:hypothetical protein
MMRPALILLLVAVAALAPAGALAMGHCQAMSAACQGPCASYACVTNPVPLVYTPREIDSAVPPSADRAPDTLLGSLDPPPRPLSLPA